MIIHQTPNPTMTETMARGARAKDTWKRIWPPVRSGREINSKIPPASTAVVVMIPKITAMIHFLDIQANLTVPG